ncbi:hypothetical protein EDD58_103507 [Hazenella coriacea]|uniref:Uncharacterized protein n=1 Tax=Hazenella coriacea TaxID=1179467 RepID=A0A4R3L5K6_9BACL|nr:hypothetical protein EDD58_103507 [Hazenella coriacea]
MAGNSPQTKDSLLKVRVQRLESQVASLSKQIQSLTVENQKLRKDSRFFELMLLEQYQILIQLMGRNPSRLRVHSVIRK